MSTRKRPPYSSDELDRVARIVSDFLLDMGDRRVAVVFTDMVGKDYDYPTVITNKPMSDVEFIFAATGLLGPLVEGDHPVKCMTVKSLFGPDQAVECSECEKRGEVPGVQQGIRKWDRFVESGGLEALLRGKFGAENGASQHEDTKVDRPVSRRTSKGNKGSRRKQH